MNVSPIALQTMPGFYMECHTGLKWLKEGIHYCRFQTGVCQNGSKEVLLTGPKIQAKIPSHSGDCVLVEGQLCPAPL